MFDGASNIQLEGRLLKVHYPKLTLMCCVEHIASFLYNFSRIPIIHQMIYVHKVIYNIFSSGIYHKPKSNFKYKYKEFHNKTIGIFSRNYTLMARRFMGMYRDLQIKKYLQLTIMYA